MRRDRQVDGDFQLRRSNNVAMAGQPMIIPFGAALVEVLGRSHRRGRGADRSLFGVIATAEDKATHAVTRAGRGHFGLLTPSTNIVPQRRKGR